MSTKLPLYQCHKQVRAARITSIDYKLCVIQVYVGKKVDVEIQVTADWLDKHDPVIGGYYVVYEDGYRSFSPMSVFEDGYSKL